MPKLALSLGHETGSNLRGATGGVSFLNIRLSSICHLECIFFPYIPKKKFRMKKLFF